MRIAMAAIATLLLGAMAWPELGRYRAEWLLADANARLSETLRGAITGADAVRSTETALAQSRQAAIWIPEDPRTALAASVALLLLQRGAEARDILNAAIKHAERPELTLNLGRARGILGDAAGADAAFLRTAWASPAAIATLPSAMRAPLLERVADLETDLRAGRLREPPPLNAPP